MRFLFLAPLMACSLVFADEGPQPKNLMLDQRDTTDSLAIPLDSSDVEDEIEMENMQEEQKEYFKKNPEAYKEWLRKKGK